MSGKPQARILGLGTALPPFSYSQEEVFKKAGYERDIIGRVFRNSAIKTRFLAIAPHEKIPEDPQWFSDHYKKWAPVLSAQAARQALAWAAIENTAIDYLITTSCTGYLCPGLNHILARELSLSNTIKTANMLGMGCNAALPALERAVEFAERYPGRNVLCVNVEVCSATCWIDDNDLESAVGNAIFGDGASAVIIRAEDCISPGVRILKFASRANREFLHFMGFKQEQGRLRVLLSGEVPDVIIPLAEEALEDLFKDSGLQSRDIKTWIVHPGGKKILERFQSKMGFQAELRASWDVLARFGNMSSATLLFVLKEALKNKAQGPAVMLAMGPGLSVETALLEVS